METNLKINRKTIGRDTLAGLTAAVAAIPDGMASAVLAGVNPVYGLYNLIIGTPVAALTTSSIYMAVINTSAMALVVNSALAGFSGEEQLQAMVTLTILVGLFQLALGLLKLGFLTRFISNPDQDRLAHQHLIADGDACHLYCHVVPAGAAGGVSRCSAAHHSLCVSGGRTGHYYGVGPDRRR